jgi:hypothetical protein
METEFGARARKTEEARAEEERARKVNNAVTWLAKLASANPKYGLEVGETKPFIFHESPRISEELVKKLLVYTGVTLASESLARSSRARLPATNDACFTPAVQLRLHVFLICAVARTRIAYLARRANDVGRRKDQRVLVQRLVLAVEDTIQSASDATFAGAFNSDSLSRREDGVYAELGLLMRKAGASGQTIHTTSELGGIVPETVGEYSDEDVDREIEKIKSNSMRTMIREVDTGWLEAWLTSTEESDETSADYHYKPDDYTPRADYHYNPDASADRPDASADRPDASADRPDASADRPDASADAPDEGVAYCRAILTKGIGGMHPSAGITEVTYHARVHVMTPLPRQVVVSLHQTVAVCATGNEVGDTRVTSIIERVLNLQRGMYMLTALPEPGKLKKSKTAYEHVVIGHTCPWTDMDQPSVHRAAAVIIYMPYARRSISVIASTGSIEDIKHYASAAVEAHLPFRCNPVSKTRSMLTLTREGLRDAWDAPYARKRLHVPRLRDGSSLPEPRSLEPEAQQAAPRSSGVSYVGIENTHELRFLMDGADYDQIDEVRTVVWVPGGDNATVDDAQRARGAGASLLVVGSDFKKVLDAVPDDTPRWIFRPTQRQSAVHRIVFCVAAEPESVHGLRRGLAWTAASLCALSTYDKGPVITLHAEHELTLARASSTTMSIRKAGIDAAFDYISAVYPGGLNAKARAAMCKGKQNRRVTPIQELVYLTLHCFEDPPTRTMRIYHLAAGSGKTRAMGIAMFGSIATHGVSTHGDMIGLVLDEKAARGHLRHEILASLSPLVKLEPEGGTLWKAIAPKNDLGAAVVLLKNKCGVVVVTTKELIEAIGTGTGANPLSGCRVVIADECHTIMHLMPSLPDCTHFYGFSATPFRDLADIASAKNWLGGSLTDKEFVTTSVCFVDSDAMSQMLPYASLKSKLLVAKSAALNALPADHYRINIEDSDSGPIACVDYNSPLTNPEYALAIEAVLQDISDAEKTRSFIYLQNSDMMTQFKEAASAAYKLVLAAIDLASEIKSGKFVPSGIIVIDETGNDTLRVFVNALTGDTYVPYKAVVTTKSTSIEYIGVERTYIVGTLSPLGYVQAQGRAHRMCSQYPSKKNVIPEHTIHYAVVESNRGEEPPLLRGAYALASAHPAGGASEVDRLVFEHARQLSIRRKKTTLSGSMMTSKPTAREGGDDYADALGKGEAVTVTDILARLKGNGRYGSVQTHDPRIARLIAQLHKGSSSGKKLRFDSGNEPLVEFHHTLRGITFTMAALEPTLEAGTLVLRYSKGPPSHSGYADAERASVRDEGLVVESALNSITVFDGVTSVYYVSAHLIQCRGHARFECFRAIGATSRVFVGTKEEFDSFIDTIAGMESYGTRGVRCHTTPMMLEAAIRRELLKSATVRVETRGSYGAALSRYLNMALHVGDWKGHNLFTCNHATAAVEAVEAVDAVGAADLEEETQISVFVTHLGAEPKLTDVLLESPPITWEPTDHKPANGTLLVYSKVEVEAKALPVGLATVDIRGVVGAYKSAVSDHRNVRCNAVVFVGVKPIGYARARVVADRYYYRAA